MLMLMTDLTLNLARARELLNRHPGLSIALTEGQLGLYEARLDSRLIGTSARLATLVDLLEEAERH